MGRKVNDVSPPLSEAQLLPVRGTEPISAGTLWADKPTLLLLIRRPGCVLCRAEARRLWGMRKEIEATGCNLICLLHELLPNEVKAFQPAFFGGEVFLDVSKAFYKEVGEGKIRKGSWLSFIWNIFSLRKKQLEAQKTVDEANNTGTHTTLGGLLIIKPGDVVSWRFSEKQFAHYAESAEILAACQAAGQPGVKK